jgi:hypothetical protein
MNTLAGQPENHISLSMEALMCQRQKAAPIEPWQRPSAGWHQMSFQVESINRVLTVRVGAENSYVESPRRASRRIVNVDDTR